MEIDNSTHSFRASELAAASPLPHVWLRHLHSKTLRPFRISLNRCSSLPGQSRQPSWDPRPTSVPPTVLWQSSGSLPRSLDFRGAMRNQMPFENQPPLPAC